MKLIDSFETELKKPVRALNEKDLKRIENASYAGVRRFYAEVAAAQQQAAQQEQAQADGTITD